MADFPKFYALNDLPEHAYVRPDGVVMETPRSEEQIGVMVLYETAQRLGDVSLRQPQLEEQAAAAPSAEAPQIIDLYAWHHVPPRQ